MSLTANTALHQSACQPKSVSLIARIGYFLALARQRRQLAALDDHLLADIGITATQARQESAKVAWDVPNYWHH